MTIAYNAHLVAKLLDRAGHPATGDNEALTSLRMADRILDKAGKSIGDVVRFVETEYFMDLLSCPHDVLMAKMADMAIERDDAVSRAKKIADENKALRQEQAELAEKYSRAFRLVVRARAMRKPAPAIATETPHTIAHLRSAIQARRNVGSYWRDFFLQGTPQATSEMMEAWKVADDVPAWAFEAVARLDPETYIGPRNPLRRAKNSGRPIDVKMTPKTDEATRFMELVASGMLNYQIAKIMSKEFNRIVSITEIEEREASSLKKAA